MRKIDVIFAGSDSRQNPGVACDYMLAKTDVDGEEVELYAEILIDDFCKEHGMPFEGDEFDMNEVDDAIYPVLWDEIVKQAAKHGISEDELKFWWD